MSDDLSDKSGVTSEAIGKLRLPYTLATCPGCGYGTVTAPGAPYPRVCPICWDNGTDTMKMSTRPAESWDVVNGPDARAEIGAHNFSEEIVVALNEMRDALQSLVAVVNTSGQRINGSGSGVTLVDVLSNIESAMRARDTTQMSANQTLIDIRDAIKSKGL